jgi:hypothetical protein
MQPGLQVLNLAESVGQGSLTQAQILARLAQLQIAGKSGLNRPGVPRMIVLLSLLAM